MVSAAVPGGRRWVQTRRDLFTTIWAYRACYYCSEAIRYPGWRFGEVAHLYSKVTHPHLAMAPGNWVPAHGSGDKRSPSGLNCNWLAHNSPDAPRGPDGKSLPFSAAFIAAKQQQGRAQLARRTRGPDAQPPPPETIAPPPGTAPTGRDWSRIPIERQL